MPASRRTNWTFTGVPGGIPNRTNICATFDPGASAAQINTAISNCSNSGGVVFLNAGTYTAGSLNGTIQLYKSNVTLRGAGADKTILQSQSGAANIVQLGNGNNTSLGTAITGGGTQGSNTITVASTANLSARLMIEIDRDDDPGLVVKPNSNDYNCHNATNSRFVTQVNVITAINGNTLTLRNPLYYDFSTGNPKVKFYYNIYTQASGIEDLKLDYGAETSGSYNLTVQDCDSCWIKGVDSYKALGYHVLALGGMANFEVRDSIVHVGGQGPDNAGVELNGDYTYSGISSAKIENNIFDGTFPNVEMLCDVGGSYVGYIRVRYSPGKWAEPRQLVV